MEMTDTIPDLEAHQHDGPLLICTDPDCPQTLVCSSMPCLLSHRHAKHFISVPCLESQLQSFMQRKAAGRHQVQSLVEQYYDEMAELFLKHTQIAKVDSLRAVGDALGISHYKQLVSLQKGGKLLELDKKTLMEINQLVHGAAEVEKVENFKRRLEQKKGAVAGQVQKFVMDELRVKMDQNLTGFKFSEILKGSNMQLAPTCKTVTQKTYNGEYQRFCFIESALEIGTPSQVQLRVGLNSWVGVGLLVRSELLEIDLKFEYSDLVKGIYMISSNGYSWQHNDRYINNSLPFKDSDIVEVQFDPVVLEVRFRLKGKLLIMQVDEDLIYEGNIFFGVNLSSHNDNCTIIE